MSEVLHQQPDPYPNRIVNVEKAYHMALTGNQKRLEAVRYRRNYGRDDRYSQSLDHQAERLEDWAGLLYDSPVSEEYKQLHLHPLESPEQGRFEYTAEDMFNLENALPKLQRRLYNGIGIDQGRFDAGRLLTSKKPTRWYLLTELRKFKGPIEQRLEELIQENSTTLGDLVQTYREVWQEIYDNRASQINQIENMLDDVRSGRASTPTKPRKKSQLKS